jgi:hypothetical protein
MIHCCCCCCCAAAGLSRMLTHGSKVVTKTYGTITHMPPESECRWVDRQLSAVHGASCCVPQARLGAF